MENLSKFCTCTDQTCPMHPTNHERGCSPCIADNLNTCELPTCFFKRVDPDYNGDTFTFEDFARLVLKEEKAKPPETTLFQKGKYTVRGLDLARKDAVKKAREAMGENDVIDTIIETGSKAVIGIGTFAIKNAEKVVKKVKGDEDEEEAKPETVDQDPEE